MNHFWQSVGILTAMALAIACLAPILAYGARKFADLRGHRAALAVIAVAFCFFAGAKHGPKIVDKPDWMSATAEGDTNTWNQATFYISSNGIVPPDTPLYIDLALADQPQTNWVNHVSTTWASRPGLVSFANLTPSNPTNYIVRIRCDASPEGIAITDFAAIASVTSRFMSCTFTAPTNIVGKTAIIEVQRDPEISIWLPVYSFNVQTNNDVSIIGNFISNGQDRRVRVRVEADIFNLGSEE